MGAFYNIESGNLPVMPRDMGKNWHQDSVARQKGFPYYHWLQTESGVGEFFVGEQRFELRPGMAILIAPGVPHRYQSVSFDQEWRINFATFHGPIVNQLADYLGDQTQIFLDVDQGRKQAVIINRIFYMVQEGRGDSYQISNLAYEFFVKLGLYQQVTTKLSAGDDYDRYITPVIAYINEHIEKDIQISELSDSLFISPQYLRRLFHDYLGMAPTQYILQARIKFAKGLLLNKHNLKISEIAVQSGFADPRYFARIFKREMGMTPLTYRKWQK